MSRTDHTTSPIKVYESLILAGRVGIEPTTNGLKVSVGFCAVFVFKHLPGRPLLNCRTMHNDAGLIHAKLTYARTGIEMRLLAF